MLATTRSSGVAASYRWIRGSDTVSTRGSCGIFLAFGSPECYQKTCVLPRPSISGNQPIHSKSGSVRTRATSSVSFFGLFQGWHMTADHASLAPSARGRPVPVCSALGRAATPFRTFGTPVVLIVPGGPSGVIPCAQCLNGARPTGPALQAGLGRTIMLGTLLAAKPRPVGGELHLTVCPEETKFSARSVRTSTIT